MAIRSAGDIGRSSGDGVTASGLPTVNYGAMTGQAQQGGSLGGGGLAGILQMMQQFHPQQGTSGGMTNFANVIDGNYGALVTPTGNTGGAVAPTQGIPTINGPFLNQQRRDQLTSALNSTFSGINSGMTAGQIQSSLDQTLTSSGWTADAISAVNRGATAAEPHGLSFREQGGNAGPFIQSWGDNILAALASVTGTSALAGGNVNGGSPFIPPVIQPPPALQPPTGVQGPPITWNPPTASNPVAVVVSRVFNGPTTATVDPVNIETTSVSVSKNVDPTTPTIVGNGTTFFQQVVAQLLHGGTLLSNNLDGSKTILNGGGFVETVNADGSQQSGAYGSDPVAAAAAVVTQAAALRAGPSILTTTPADGTSTTPNLTVPNNPISGTNVTGANSPADLAAQLIGSGGTSTYGPGSGSIGGGVGIPDVGSGVTPLVSNPNTTTSSGPSMQVVVVGLIIVAVVGGIYFFMHRKKKEA